MSDEEIMTVEQVEKEELENIKDLKYEEKLKFANVIAKPMASKKLCKKIIKLLKKGKLCSFF